MTPRCRGRKIACRSATLATDPRHGPHGSVRVSRVAVDIARECHGEHLEGNQTSGPGRRDAAAAVHRWPAGSRPPGRAPGSRVEGFRLGKPGPPGPRRHAQDQKWGVPRDGRPTCPAQGAEGTGLLKDGTQIRSSHEINGKPGQRGACAPTRRTQHLAMLTRRHRHEPKVAVWPEPLLYRRAASTAPRRPAPSRFSKVFPERRAGRPRPRAPKLRRRDPSNKKHRTEHYRKARRERYWSMDEPPLQQSVGCHPRSGHRPAWQVSVER